MKRDYEVVWTSKKGKKMLKRIAVEEEMKLKDVAYKLGKDYFRKKGKKEEGNGKFEFKW